MVGGIPNHFGISATYPTDHPRVFGSYSTVVPVDMSSLERSPTIAA